MWNRGSSHSHNSFTKMIELDGSFRKLHLIIDDSGLLRTFRQKKKLEYETVSHFIYNKINNLNIGFKPNIKYDF